MSSDSEDESVPMRFGLDARETQPRSEPSTQRVTYTPGAMVRVGVCGSCSPLSIEDPRWFDAALYERIVREVDRVIRHDWRMRPADVTLVSYGLPWVAHVPISLLKRGYWSVRFVLLADWDEKTHQFVRTSVPTITGTDLTARTMNKEHRAFRKRVGIDSLEELHAAISTRYMYRCEYNMFYLADAFADTCDYLVNVSFESNEPTSMFTQRVWQRFRAIRAKRHLRVDPTSFEYRVDPVAMRKHVEYTRRRLREHEDTARDEKMRVEKEKAI